MRHVLHLAAATLLLAALHACVHQHGGGVTRERAIDIARAHVSFQASSAEAVRTSVGGRPIWRVTLRGRLPGQPPGLFETRIFEIDRMTGAIVSVART